MKKNINRWKFAAIVFLLAWALFEIYPPTSADLAATFEEKAQNKDAVFTNILTRFRQQKQARPQAEFGDLLAAVGTNNITGYFPYYDVPARAQSDPGDSG